MVRQKTPISLDLSLWHIELKEDGDREDKPEPDLVTDKLPYLDPMIVIAALREMGPVVWNKALLGRFCPWNGTGRQQSAPCASTR